ncbi:threonine-phosphate decarboxylase [Synechococcales cyanobacterium C]|uniref:threonine-phosphate decarboxylase n=1 Tax=Petrachloros mirabilis ULC683 TaxID=2781853 RepID=A0A8K1ZXS0_9CYAN|nr:threonine-phosphate decarboxylase CobD [Petrachloros mirabilis]NCJ05828.1 threonine-phosphate decarboxylase [Petrachloros mirabilis ULC683]
MKRPQHGGNLAWAAALAGCPPDLLLDFSASINPLGPPASALDAIQASLGQLRHYPDPSYATLRQTLGAVHQLPSEWILPGNGSAELLTWVCRELAQLDGVEVWTPAFGDYGRALRAFGAQVVPQRLASLEPAPLAPQFWGQPEDGTSLTPGCGDDSNAAPLAPQFWGEPERRKAAQGVLLNNPHNPTGQLFSVASLLPLLEQYALVVVDEAFMDFLPPAQQQSLILWVQRYPNLVILRSLTKFYSLPGLRLGYAVAHPERLERWQQWRDPWSVNGLAEPVTVAMLADSGFQQRTWDWLGGARSHLFRGLAQIPGLHPRLGAANFLLVHSDYSVTQLQTQLLQQHRILIRDCLSFPELGDDYFRVAVRTEAENQKLLEGLAAVSATLGTPYQE